MVVGIIGFTGMGKSTLASYLSQRAPTRIIVDPRNQYWTTDDVLPNNDGLYELLDNRYEIIVRPGRGTTVQENFDGVCETVADWIEDNPTERISFIGDETRLLGLDTRSPSTHFDWIIRSARAISPIDVILTCHRPADLHTNIRAITDRMLFFRQTLPNDLDAVEWQCGPIVREEVRKLLDREFITWNNSRQQWKKTVDALSWFVDIERLKEKQNA